MPAVTLYRFHIELSDLDRGVYETLDFRAAQHPSETNDFLITRALAFALNWQEGIEFSSQGLHDVEDSPIQLKGAHGTLALAIEIGNPSAKKLHKVSKSATTVKVYTYKDPRMLVKEVQAHGSLHRAEAIEVIAFDPKFLAKVADHLERDNRWSLLIQDSQLTLSFDEGKTEVTDLRRISLVG